MKIDHTEHGVTYRQFDHWSRKGWIRAEGDGGSGSQREFSRPEVKIFVLMATLVRIGFKPQYAAEYARRAVTNGFRGRLEIEDGRAKTFGLLSAKALLRTDARPMPPDYLAG